MSNKSLLIHMITYPFKKVGELAFLRAYVQPKKNYFHLLKFTFTTILISHLTIRFTLYVLI